MTRPKVDWDLLREKIWIAQEKIVICSTLKDVSEEILCLIEDNIYIEPDMDNCECIDWASVEEQYEANIETV